ncbi:MAG: cyanophycinase [Planctomycetota bacterium JB042]
MPNLPRSTLALVTFLLTLVTLTVPLTAAPGPLVVVGGGGTPDEVVRRALELAGGKDARVLILPQASSRGDAGRSTAEMFREAGAKRVDIAKLKPARAAREKILAADLLWMSGGSQRRLMEALREARLIDAVREAHANGAVVGGTSAGAAVLSARMITGEADLEGVGRGRTELEDGLGLWPGVIVDQHFLKRRRNNRLLAAVLDHPGDLGVGIDERTAVIVRGDRFEVAGTGGVLVYDARQAEIEDGEAGDPHAARGVRLHLLRPGETFETN